jgi:hypothetical protein
MPTKDTQATAQVGDGLSIKSTPLTFSDAGWNAAVSRWLAGQIANSPVSQSTPAFNHLLAALPALRDELQKEMN